jgi:uncharacterized membrane protein
MGLAILIFGLVVFLISHVFVTFRDARATLIARLGRVGYHGLFAVVSLIGLALIVWGYADYRAYEWVAVWSPPAFLRHVTIGLMLIASVLLMASPIPSHVRTWAKHPMLASIKIWAFAHLLINGDLGSILLFGTFLGWAVYAWTAAKQRDDAGPRKAPVGWGGDLIAVGAGIVLFLVLGLAFHPYVIGVPVLGV